MKKKDEKSNDKGKVNLCHSMREEVKVPDAIRSRSAIFLKHPGDEDDEEEEEGEVDLDMEEESREGDRFKLQELHQEQD